MSELNHFNDTVRPITKGSLVSNPSSQVPSKQKKSVIHSALFYMIVILESCIFPIPPDPFFIVKALKNPKKVWLLAGICTVLSALGGCITYAIGLWFYQHWGSFLLQMCGGEGVFLNVKTFMHRWGALAIIAKGFTPVPYKVMALISGVTQFSFLTFFVTSLVARGIRFSLLALFVHRYHDRAEKILNRYRHWLKRFFMSS